MTVAMQQMSASVKMLMVLTMLPSLQPPGRSGEGVAKVVGAVEATTTVGVGAKEAPTPVPHRRDSRGQTRINSIQPLIQDGRGLVTLTTHHSSPAGSTGTGASPRGSARSRARAHGDSFSCQKIKINEILTNPDFLQ